MILATPVTVPPGLLWWHILLMIVAGGTITVFGFHHMVRDWITCEEKDKRLIMVMDVVALVVCTAAGTIVGERIWDAALGGVMGLLGGLGYKFFMKIINKALKRRGLNGNGNGDRFGGSGNPDGTFVVNKPDKPKPE
jgi:hypothetical protein